MAKKTTEPILNEPTLSEDNVSEVVEAPVEALKETKDTDEVAFLKRIYAIQNEGGFGRHLNDLLNERIKELKTK
jgi:hypothetical protein